MTSGMPSSSYQSRSWTKTRLGFWRRYAEAGWKTSEIAAELGISESTLTRFVQRARRRGDPDAIVHPNWVPPGQGDPMRPDRTRTGRKAGRLRSISKII